MKRTGSLKFKMTHGGCGTFVLEESGNEEILLCFSDENDTSCTRSVPYITPRKSLRATNVQTLNFKVLKNLTADILDSMELMVKMSTIHLSGITLQNLVIITNVPVLPTTKEPHLP